MRIAAVMVLGCVLGCGGRETGSPPTPVPQPQPQPPMEACIAPASPTTLAEIDGAAHFDALAVVKGWAYFGVKKPNADLSIPLTGRIERVHASDGAREIVGVDYLGGPIASDGTDLFFLRTVLVESPNDMTWYDHWWSKPEDVLARALDGGDVRTIGAAGPYGHGELRTNSTRGVVWTAKSATNSQAIARWDGSAVTTIVPSAQFDGPENWALDGERVYWSDRDTLDSAPLVGGAPQTIAPSSPGVQFLGVDARSVYLAPLSEGVRAVDKSNGYAANITPPGTISGGLVDAGWLYYIDWKNHPTAILRVRVADGTKSDPEIFYQDTNDAVIRSIAADACSIHVAVAHDFASTSVHSQLVRLPK